MSYRHVYGQGKPDNHKTNYERKKMKVRFQKRHPRAVIPTRATPGSLGYDLTAVALEDTPTCYKYHTGIAIELPPGYVGFIFPRSGVAKKGAWMSNSVGVIDSDYRGEITACFYNFGNPPYKPEDRIAQLIIMPVPTIEFDEAEELSKTERGEGSYGSTGR